MSMCLTVPLHKVYIQSPLVTGEVLIGVVDSLPICGVGVVLGNDLTDNCLDDTVQVSEVSDIPIHSCLDVASDIFPACVTTRSTTTHQRLMKPEEIGLSDTMLSQWWEENDKQEDDKNVGSESSLQYEIRRC